MATKFQDRPELPDSPPASSVPVRTDLQLARVLLVDTNPASRLTLKVVLEAGGYRVDSAETTAEGIDMLDQHPYELVVSDLQTESPEAGIEVLAHARLMEYQPATAILSTCPNKRSTPEHAVLIEPQDLPELLTKVADLISQRAARLVASQLLAG